MYENDIKKMDLILTNSENTKNRINEFLWLDSVVLYPPVNLNEFKYLWQEDYYLSFARLSDAKRVDLIVKAFKKMPDKKLIVIYWENDPSRLKIFSLASWFDNIEFITLEWNIWFTKYVWNCIATIYIPIDEDFWMSPVESMSAWKPVLWVNDWWLKETIIANKTWLLIWKEANVNEIINWIHYLTPEICIWMKKDCENRAREFGLDEFETKLKKIIK
jgi:glycosyltransferase involved in cell wall biosynthesis